MTQTEHHGNAGLSMVLAFVGGAVMGGAAALLLAPGSGEATRKRLTGAVDGAREMAEQLPQAVRAASGAAQGAFVKSMKEA